MNRMMMSGTYITPIIPKYFTYLNMYTLYTSLTPTSAETQTLWGGMWQLPNSIQHLEKW